MSQYMVLFSELFLIVGLIVGWLAADRFHEYMEKNRHPYEELFEQNPHPEIFTDDGDLFRGEYVSLNFEPGYDPDEFDPEDLYEGA